MGKITNYIPIIKTVDAEIKGYENLADEVKKKATPIFELTRSRPLKNYPEGDIVKRMEQIVDATNGAPFFLDLTSHDDLSNNQIRELQDDTNGFQMWRQFLSRYKPKASIVPFLHLYEDDLETYKKCTIELLKDFSQVVFRISTAQSPDDLRGYLDKVKAEITLESQYHLAIDAGYLTRDNFWTLHGKCRSLVDVAREYGIQSISVHSSSFPASVMQHPQGNDSEGEMDLFELTLHDKLNSPDSPVVYGDYAGIHPIRKSIGGGTWVPRVDLTVDQAYIYKRYRRDVGGYEVAARELVAWAGKYDPVDSWGKTQI